ncbi:phosphoadenosine phosphosulfate reductase [Mesobaculum littorinae]|uniref:Phosphoadenosine phosphosulfate reductase n=1 Tax=Mesobaculum littorinae TaxID=2486419 RepID=A0A438AJJ1_9RHOB|nr:phosphoadenosine phosphosulfate reductase [Mesobaculum littorinae]RVV98852.1 phosphoadenosine phosphosulfate reductase [Mesobaculum littorinae]
MTILDNSFDDEFDDEDDDDEVDAADLHDFAYGLNPAHFVRFERRGPQLLVSFDVVYDRDAPLKDRRARLDPLAHDHDWSVLSLTSQGNTWFRAPEIVTFFDALVDGTLLDQFDDVLFYGAGSGGHAALSYALTAPMSRVLALAPQATLDPRMASWDTRFRSAEDIDFASRYLPSPGNLAASEQVYVAFDPLQEEDARHAALLSGPTTLELRCRRMGPRLEDRLTEMGKLDDIVAAAMTGDLDGPGFYTALRTRRDDSAYLRRIVARLIEDDRPWLEALVVRNIAQRTGRTRYLRRFERLAAELEDMGMPVPPSRADEPGD